MFWLILFLIIIVLYSIVNRISLVSILSTISLVLSVGLGSGVIILLLIILWRLFSG